MAALTVRRWLQGALAVAVLSACGRVDRNADGTDPTAGTSATAGSANAGGTVGAGGSTTSVGGGGGSGGSQAGTAATCCELGQCPCGGQAMELGRGVVPMHRLRGAEYVNTVKDLLVVDTAAPVADEEKPYDAVIADAGPWIAAASNLTRQLFEDPQRALLLPAPINCASVASPTRECASTIVTDFGLRAFRRPVLDEEKAAFLGVFDELSKTDSPRAAVQQMVRAMLLSPAFLFHVELSDDPDGTAPEPLDSYALAARLSFALWRTTPDPDLLAAAQAGLTDDAPLTASFERLTQSERWREEANGLVDVWLGADRLLNHDVDVTKFPNWSASSALDAVHEEREFAQLFMADGQPLNELLTLQHGPQTGALGQRALLALSSLPRRTSATLRGKYVMETLLCHPLPPPPPGGPDMMLGPDYPVGKTERETLDAAVANPVCKACHSLMDPIGYALGNYDAVGEFRSVDESGKPIDAAVSLNAVFPAGNVDGLAELARAISGAPDFPACASRQLASYLVQRDLTVDTDPDLLSPLTAAFAAQGTLRDLTHGIVLSDQFRYRRLPALPTLPVPPSPGLP